MFNSIAVFYEDHGALTRAYAFYKKSVHFCRSDKNYSELLRRLIVVVIELGQFEASAEIAEKGMQYPNLHPITMETLRCALGLARFKAHCYKDAAHQVWLSQSIIISMSINSSVTHILRNIHAALGSK